MSVRLMEILMCLLVRHTVMERCMLILALQVTSQLLERALPDLPCRSYPK